MYNFNYTASQKRQNYQVNKKVSTVTRDLVEEGVSVSQRNTKAQNKRYLGV